MEASQAQTEAAEAQSGQQEGADGAQEAQQQDANPLVDRFDQFEQGMGQRLDQLEERLPEADPDGGEDMGLEQDDAPQYLQDPDTGEIFDPQTGRIIDPAELDQREQQRAFEQMRNQMQQEMQQQLAPVLEYFEDRQAADLEAKYPKLQQGEWADKVLQTAEERAAQFGKPELAKNAGFLEMVHLQLEGQQRATQETPAGAPEQGVGLEVPGAQPPGREEDPGDRIVEVSRQRNQFFS